MSRIFALLLALLAAPATLAATGVCDPESRDGDEAPASPAELLQVDAILPCAMAENGFMGPACADAPLYVVTPSGVVLCQVSFAMIAPHVASSQLTARPSAELLPTWSWSSPDALQTTTPAVPRPAIDDAPRCTEVPAHPPEDLDPEEPWGPS